MIRTEKYPVACHAPEITLEKIAEYEAIISSVEDREVKDRCLDLIECVKAYIIHPTSTEDVGETFVYGEGDAKKSCKIHPFDQGKISALWGVTPYMSDLAAYEACFERISPEATGDGSGKVLRDLAFHLLWYAKEITLDREPLTASKLS